MERTERLLDDGAVPIDSNVSEREVKRTVLNRKNSLCVGNARGWHDVDPQKLYLAQLLIHLPTLPISQLPQWLPDQWKIHHIARLNSLHNRVLQTA
jgi:transposase